MRRMKRKTLLIFSPPPTNDAFCLSWIPLNHLITAWVFRHKFTLVACAVFLTMCCRISLLILPISNFVGLIRRQVRILLRLGL